MKLIFNNPYRVAGTLSNASEKELLRQKGKITAYLKVGKTVDSDLDFNFFQKIVRTENSTKAAFSKIEQSKDRVFHGLFWLLEANSFDTKALRYLKEGDTSKAVAIWEKETYRKEISDLNYSSFSNLGTLKLLGTTELEIQEGIEAKIKLIESPSFKDYAHAVADETFTIDRHSQIEQFIDAVFDEFKAHYQTENIVRLFAKCNGIAAKYTTKKSTQEPISYLESKIESTKSKRNDSRIKAYEYGLRPHADCQQELSTLRSILGDQDLKYKIIADKLANAIMQCGVDYFNAWKDDKDVSEQSLELLKYAQSIAVGSQMHEKIKDQIEGIEEWAKTAPIQEDLAFINNKFETLRHKPDSISSAEDLIESCQPKLQDMKLTLGSQDELYINVSSGVVITAQNILVAVINQAQKNLANHRQITELQVKVKKAFLIHDKLGELDMSPELLTQYLDTHVTIKSLASQLGVNIYQISTSTSTSSSIVKNWPLIIIGIGAIIGLIYGGIGGFIGGGITTALLIGFIVMLKEGFE